MTLKTQSVFLLKANENLEGDLIQFVNEISGIKNAHLAWSQTYYDIRLDDLEGVIYEYYLKEIDNNYVFKLPNKTFKNVLAPLKIITSILSKLFETKREIPEQAIWFSSAKNTKRNRYRHLMSYFENQKITYFHASHIIDINVSENESSLNFTELFKVKDIFKAIITAIVLKHNLDKNKNNSYVAIWVKNLPRTHFFNMAIREILVNRAIKKYKPKAIFFTTANTYSPARLMSRLAKLNEVPFVVVACRSMFTFLRPEERACEIDLQEINDARIADYFIVWDLFSKKTLTKSNINADKIYVSQLKSANVQTELILKDEFIVLLTHQKSMNDLMIQELLKVFQPYQKIVIRTHPLCKLTDYQYERLSCFEILDISNFAMNSIEFNNCIVISINSTAAVEACSYGCGILWLPYLNEKSVIFEPVMSILGSVINDSESFVENIKVLELKEKRSELIDNCKDSFGINFTKNDALDSLFKKINISF